MMISRLTRLTSHCRRITYCGMHVDIVETSEGLVRVGSMPDIAKLMAVNAFREEIVIVPPWEATMAGDNRTGEEFVLWQAQVNGGRTKRYVGAQADLDLLYRNLNETFKFYFDDKRLVIESRAWIDNWFSKKPAAPLFEKGTLEIKIESNNIILVDQGQILYDWRESTPVQNPNQLVDEVLAKTPRDSRPRETLEVQAIGTGNGFSETVSNCIVRFGDKVIWIDPCGYPAHALSRYLVHWDDVTHLLITHNHEDHIQGFSACLKRAEKTRNPIKLITAPSIHDVLKKQFTPLCPNFSSLVELFPLTPDIQLTVGEIEIRCRWNHHFLPFGTLGLKFSARGKIFGYSGDTKFDSSINKVLNRKELQPEWFAECDLVFHEVDFFNHAGVHTHWKQLQKLTSTIPGQVLCYHTPYLPNAPLPLAEQGKIYYLK